mgnify:CR=1 FL=1
MSTAALQNVWESLFDYNLSPADMRWLGERLINQAESEDVHTLEPYTMDEINAMINQAENEIAAGNCIDDDVVWHEFDEEFAQKVAV